VIQEVGMRRGWGGLWLALALVAAAPGVACQRTPPPSITGVKVGAALSEAVAEVGLDGAAVEAVTRSALAEAGFRLEAAKVRAFEARIDVVVLRVASVAGGPGLQAELAVEVELAPSQGDEPPHKETGRATELVGAGGPTPAVRAALVSAVGEAVRALRVSVAADVKTNEALIADLASGDARVRSQAVQALGERGVKGAVPALIERLRDGDPKVAHRAVGALAQIKDPRAVPALIDLCRSGDPALTLRMARIVADIGGRDAQGWLLVLEAAHPDPRVRETAAEALDDLRRAEPAPRKPADGK
jgi:HEAT repeat protein